jgi:hypothetical protein
MSFIEQPVCGVGQGFGVDVGKDQQPPWADTPGHRCPHASDTYHHADVADHRANLSPVT